MKTFKLILIFLFISSGGWSQDLIQSECSIIKTISINDSFDLQFVEWPSPGMGWRLNPDYDTTLISIKFISSILMTGYKPIGGKYIETIQYKGRKKGKVKLEYTYGRPWLKETICVCKIDIIIN